MRIVRPLRQGERPGDAETSSQSTQGTESTESTKASWQHRVRGRVRGSSVLAVPVVVAALVAAAFVPSSPLVRADSGPPSEVLAQFRSSDSQGVASGIILRLDGHDPSLRSDSGMPDGAEDVGVPNAVAGTTAPVDFTAVAAAAQAALSGRPGATDGATGIPKTLLAAYHRAQQNLDASRPGCHLPWWVVAGIGRIESGHAYGGRVDAHGNTRGRILGVRLDGSVPGTAVILDSDGGRLDGDPDFDRAVGPMQFLPGTWAIYGRDGNGDGVKSPDNVFDAATATGALLCAAGGDLSQPDNLARAILAYNYSQPYVDAVLTWGVAYRDGATPSSDSAASVPPPPEVVAPAPSPTSSAPVAAPVTAAPPAPAAPAPAPSPPNPPSAPKPPSPTSTAPPSTTPPPTSTTQPPTTKPPTTEPPSSTKPPTSEPPPSSPPPSTCPSGSTSPTDPSPTDGASPSCTPTPTTPTSTTKH